MSGRRAIVGWCIGGLTFCGLGACGAGWQQTFQASASVTGAEVAGQPAFNDAIAVPFTVSDCDGNAYGGGSVVASLGPQCTLQGRWSDTAQLTDDLDDAGVFRRGSFEITSGQTCVLALGQGSKTLRIATGVGEVHGNRTVDLALGADVVGGSDAGRHLDIRLSAVPQGSTEACRKGS